MFIAKNKNGETICAHCGRVCKPTKDHYIPKSCKMTVNREGNYVGVCVTCNQAKANKIVLPSWYPYINDKQRATLLRYFRYAGIYIRANCEDEEVLQFLADTDGR